MGKHTVNRQMITSLFVNELPDILKEIEKDNKNCICSIEFFSDGSGEIISTSIRRMDKDETTLSFENLKELREFFLKNEYSDKNI